MSRVIASQFGFLEDEDSQYKRGFKTRIAEIAGMPAGKIAC
jgi:hypothetical protein